MAKDKIPADEELRQNFRRCDERTKNLEAVVNHFIFFPLTLWNALPNLAIMTHVDWIARLSS